MDKRSLLKKLMVQFYGTLGSPNNNFSGNTCAESITAQGRDLIQYSISKINYYFLNKWHKDIELHSKLHISTPSKVNHDVVTYCVNDSAYINFDIILASISETIDDIDSFIGAIYEHRLKMYFDIVFNKYCEKFNVENRFLMEYEGYYKNAIFFSTNNYIMFDGKEIVSKGATVLSPSSSDYSKEIINEIALMLLRDSVTDMNKIKDVLKKHRTLFCQQDISNICSYKNVNKIEDGDGCFWHNSLIENNTRYVPISIDDVVCEYTTVDNKTFCFIPYQYPYEVAPELNYDSMFYDDVVLKVNKMTSILGIGEFDKSLKINKVKN